MTKIKKHQCPSCGGSLTIDNDKQIYRCTFCGSTYDYEYFREEQMHDMGETFLSRGEYMAAIDAYRFVLKKDPHDFLALRGLLFAATHLNDMEEIADEGKDLFYDPELINEAIEGASEEDKDYFTEFGKIFADKKELFDLRDEIDSVNAKKRKAYDHIEFNGDKREEYYLQDKDGRKYHPKTGFVIGWVAVGFLALFMIYLIAGLIEYGVNEGTAIMVGFLVFTIMSIAGVIAINYTSNYRRMKAVDAIDRQTLELYEEIHETEELRRSLEDKAEKLTLNIRIASKKFIKLDKLKMSGETAD